MEVMGHYIVPPGPYGLAMKEEYYDIRYNLRKGYMSKDILGLQVLTKFLDKHYVWININESWLCEKTPNPIPTGNFENNSYADL